VDGVTKFDVLEDPNAGDELARKRDRKRRQQAETFHKLLVAMMEDPRTVLIKIADRLHNLRTLDAVSPERQAAKARETLDIYVPLATRLGMGEAKYELEDLVLRYTDPRRYRWLCDLITREQQASQVRTQTTVRALERVLLHHGLTAEVRPHVKHLYSIHRRMVETGNDNLSEMADFTTYTVLVPQAFDCYDAMKAIHSQWHQIDRRLRDYVARPKLNGYEAIHTTVFGMLDYPDPFDIHIRSYAMQDIADHGPVLVAARHETGGWRARVQGLEWLAQVEAWQHELALPATQLVQAVQGDLFRDQIFIFTPRGEIKDVARGSTVLDFAYRIHTNLGERCTGAKVTARDGIMRLEGREYILQDRDMVQVLAQDDIHPTAAWLRAAHTHHAHEALMRYLRGPNPPTEEVDESGDYLADTEQMASVRLGYCCEPTPEDALIGVVAGQRMVVHREECRHAQEAMAAPVTVPLSHNGNTPERAAHGWFRVRWETLHPDRYRVSLLLTGLDRSGLMHDISAVLARYDLNIVNLGALSISTRYKAIIRVTVEVKRPDHLRLAMQRLRNVEGIVNVERRHRVQENDAAPA
jgi:(p)ppGpp synthase/HD superfamily hydrolase